MQRLKRAEEELQSKSFDSIETHLESIGKTVCSFDFIIFFIGAFRFVLTSCLITGAKPAAAALHTILSYSCSDASPHRPHSLPVSHQGVWSEDLAEGPIGWDSTTCHSSAEVKCQKGSLHWWWSGPRGRGCIQGSPAQQDQLDSKSRGLSALP